MTSIQEAEMNAALVRELCSGRMLMETMQQFRERDAAAEAKSFIGHRSIPGLGKHVASVPAHEWFLMRERYGEDCWSDKGFVRDFQRLEPEMASNKL